jgi:two-component system KDP operon response regulator KdpE
MAETKKTVLIVDDEKDVCEFLKLRLESFGFHAVFACDGVEGFNQAVQMIPDCVLLDIRLEISDGLTVLRKIRSYRHDDLSYQDRVRSIPVIILTAAGNSMQPLFQAEGANDYMEKPFDSSVLKAHILKAIGEHRPS